MEFHDGHSKNWTSHRLRLAATPIAIATAAGLAGCLADDVDVDEEGLSPGAPTYSISGQVSGIDEGSLQLSLNGDETITADSDGSFSFTTRLEQGTNYDIGVEGHPDYSYCDLSNAQGSMPSDDVDDVMAECEVLTVGTANDDETVHLDWARAGNVDIAYSTDIDCDWTNASTCDDGGIITGESGGNLTVDESDGFDLGETYSFALMVDEQASRPAQGTLSRYELNGPVNDAIIVDDKVFAGGEFGLHGAPLQGMARFRKDMESGLTGELNEFQADANTPAVLAQAPAPDGGMFVGGIFTTVNGIERLGIARLNPDGRLDESWEVDTDGGIVIDIIVHEDRIYIAGGFDEVNGNTDYANLAVLELDGSLDTSFASDSPDDVVWDMEIQDDTLYIGGAFTDMGGDTRNRLAALDKDDGTLSSTFQPDIDSEVISVNPTTDRIYIGGGFGTVDGSTREFFAAVDPDDGSLDSGFTANATGPVYFAEPLDGVLIVGGVFDSINGDTRIGMAAVDPETGSVQSDWDLGFNNAVIAMHVEPDTVYLGGQFSEVAGEARSGVARFDRSTEELDTSWAPVLDSQLVWGIHDNGDSLSLRGQFRGANGTAVNNLAAFELDTGDLDTDWAGPGVGNEFGSGRIEALAADDSQLYAGGFFEDATDGDSSESYANAAAFSLDDGNLTDWQPQPNNTVNDLAIHPDEDAVFLGGFLDTIDGTTFDHVAKVDSVDGSAWGAASNPHVNGNVYAIQHVEDGPYLAIAGDFTAVDINTVERFATLEEGDLSFFGSGISADDTIYALSLESGNDGVLGGAFDDLNGEGNAFFQAVVDSSPVSMEANDTVRAVRMDTDLGYAMAGGDFSEFGGQERNHFAILDVTDTGATLSSEAPEVDGSVLTIEGDSGHIAIAGGFRHYDGHRHGPLVVLDANTLSPVWEGTPSSGSTAERRSQTRSKYAGKNPLPELELRSR